MMKPRALAVTAALAMLVVLVIVSAVVWSRTQTGREAEGAGEQVKVAAERAGEKLADGWLTTKIQAQFFADEDIKSRYINVATRDGVVTLKGFVESDDARRQVLEITRNTDGVTAIDDRRLLVGRPANQSFEIASTSTTAPVATTGVASTIASVPSPDSTVVSVIQARYFLDPMIKARHIDVQIASGIVTLKGQVASENERAQALLLARSAPGVQRVEDYMTVDAALPH